jgi:hypothetical protein
MPSEPPLDDWQMTLFPFMSYSGALLESTIVIGDGHDELKTPGISENPKSATKATAPIA